MASIPRMRRLASLQLTVSAASSTTRPSFIAAIRPISTTCAAQGKNTEWVRGKLWKGDVPGPEDPYTQRLESEDDASNLPEEVFDRPKIDRTPSAILKSRLTLPPKRKEAMPENEVMEVDPSYVPAVDAAGLEEISTLKTWWDQEGHWGEESAFRGFGSPEKVVDAGVVEVYLRQSVVEALALRETGSWADWSTGKWREVSRGELDRILAAEVIVQDGGRATLGGDAALISQSLVPSETDEAGAEAAPSARITPAEAREMVRAWSASWKGLVLDDQLKFAIRKRLYQLTGILIPDARLGAAHTVKHVLTLVCKKPTPPKLADLLGQREDIQQLANVKVHDRKIGLIEKETSVGRWKVIEKELTKRGLPVTGTAGLSKNKERDWILGKV